MVLRKYPNAELTLIDLSERMLEQAGFADVDCMYKNMGFAVFYGRK